MMNRNNTCGQRNTCGYRNDTALLRKIQEIDFSLYEIILYLDAYPNCGEALNYYHSLLDTRAMLVKEYEHKHGPLTAFSNTSCNSWDWTKTPWPWQL